jgi:hypothetical protein
MTVSSVLEGGGFLPCLVLCFGVSVEKCGVKSGDGTSASLERRWFGARGRSWGKVVPDVHISYMLGYISVIPM